MIDYNYLKENNLILFEAIVGSQAYGTNTPESDIDKKFIYILPKENILGFDYIDQIKVNDDHSGWEVKRFLELLERANPTALELLYSPVDCIIHKNPLFDIILKEKEKFITKNCKNTFGNYAKNQIKKAKGLNKKQNWEKERVSKKEILDFCYVIENEKSIPLKKWLNPIDFPKDVQKFCGVINITNARDMYALYYDENAANMFSEDDIYDKEEQEELKANLKRNGDDMGLGYKGISKVGGSNNVGISNQLRLSSIPKGEEPIAIFTYNKDAYSQHCKDYKEYLEWLEKRNEQRYVDTQKHGQQIDGKNMLHCVRLLNMANEIGQEKGLIIKRKNAKDLLEIRKGKMDLQNIIDMTDDIIDNMDKVYAKSNLPDKVEDNLINELLIKIRKEIYKL
jgi:hypothetical protein